MTLCHELADRVHAFGAEQLSDELRLIVRNALIDTLGVTLLGSAEESARIAMRLPGMCSAPGEATIVGTNVRTSALDAAMVNGIASHALDFDDFTEEFGGHPSVPVFSAVLAQAEVLNATWEQVVAAYVAGVELETRLAHAVHFHHYQKGWHPTSTLGVFGAAAASAHLLALDRDATATALAIAASFASGLKGNFGTMTKPLHVGHCANRGLYAALLAQQGFSANPKVLDHRQGFFEVYNGAGNYDVARLLAPWYEPPVLQSSGLSVKQFACCGSTHPAIFMALKLKHQHQFKADDIAAVRIATHPYRLPHTDKPRPTSPLQAKFSIQYTVARALADGKVLLKDFEEGAYAEPAIARLLTVTEAGVDPVMAQREERCFGAEVTVRLSDGTSLTERTEHMPGRGKAYPMTDAELEDKFVDCAKRALSAEETARLWHALIDLEANTPVRDIGGYLRPAGAAARAATAG